MFQEEKDLTLIDWDQEKQIHVMFCRREAANETLTVIKPQARSRVHKTFCFDPKSVSRVFCYIVPSLKENKTKRETFIIFAYNSTILLFTGNHG